MASIDLERVKQDADLLAIIERDTQLKKVASTGGGEFAGACPFCGGRDKFHVQPYAKPFPIWMCRQCGAGKWDTVIGYFARRDNLDPKNHNDLAEICKRAVGDVPTTNAPHQAPAPEPAYQPPAVDWQAAAHQAIEICKNNLWSEAGQKACEYLKGRGISEKTSEYFNLGFSTGFKVGDLWIHKGIVIPCVVAGEVWYLKISLIPGDLVKCEGGEHKAPARKPCPSCGKVNKYRGVKGNRPAAIFNADSLRYETSCLVCEGEFDTMLASQEIGDQITPVTFGSATNRPDLATWGGYLLPIEKILAAFDNDEAGDKALADLMEMASNRVVLAPVDLDVKDITELYLKTHDLRAWIEPYLESYEVEQ